ncbi:MAG: hypothetical protein ACYTFY_12405, partial [Planctomycetota bacterium]
PSEGWPATFDRSYLVKGLEQTLWGLNLKASMGGIETYYHFMTEAEQFTDRVFLPTQLIARAYLGGNMQRNKFWPSFAVSWEGFEKDFAVIILEQGKDKLKFAAINLLEKERSGQFRCWQLEHGKYDLKIGPDLDDNGKFDSVDKTESMKIVKMDTAVKITLPPRKLMLYELVQKEKLDSIYERADLAMAKKEITRARGMLALMVYNIGNKSVAKSTIAILDKDRKVLTQADIPELKAPLDLTPKKVEVVIQDTPGGEYLVIDHEEKIPEITELNNEIKLSEVEVLDLAVVK